MSHVKLLIKLQSCGISGALLCWIKNFLYCRTQQTRVGSALCNVINLTSGVIYKAVFWARYILFIIFISDNTRLATDIICTCKLYADDQKLYTILHTNTDCCVFQNRLNEVCKLSKTLQLSVLYMPNAVQSMLVISVVT